MSLTFTHDVADPSECSTREATCASLFVAGWRPFIGWVCGLAFAWTFLVYPIIQVVIVTADMSADLERLPVADLTQMMPALLGMLGLGAMRSYERKSGSERNSMSETPNSNGSSTNHKT